MAIDRFGEYALVYEGAEIAFVPGSIVLGNEDMTEDLRSGAALVPDAVLLFQKKPVFSFSTLAVGLLAAPEELDGAGVQAVFRRYKESFEGGGWSATYWTLTMANAYAVPVRLAAEVGRPAVLDVKCHGMFSAGVCFTTGTTYSGTPALVTSAYFPKSMTIGSAIAGIESVNVEWNIPVESNDQWEPTYYFYRQYGFSGTATSKDMDEATVARLEDGATTATVALVLEDRLGSGADVTVTIGKSFIRATTNGERVVLSFKSVG